MYHVHIHKYLSCLSDCLDLSPDVLRVPDGGSVGGTVLHVRAAGYGDVRGVQRPRGLHEAVLLPALDRELGLAVMVTAASSPLLSL